MPVVIDRVMNMVREEIKRRPEVTSQELFEKAKKLDRGIRSLSARQFNATYPLQVRRSIAPKRRRTRTAGGRRGDTAARERARAVLLEFARTIAGAEDPGAIVDVIANLDSWVDRVTGGNAQGGPRKRGRPPAA